MPENLSPTEVKAILDSGNFDELIGAVEDERLECKGKPYQIKKDHQKQELAKDVAGLANAGGGIILIGVRTVRDPTHFGDEIKDVRSFEQNLINSNQYQDILNKWIYPSLQQVEIRWFRSRRNKKKGVVSIFIPIQPPGQQPFLITRTIDDMGKLGEVVFGYAERKRANVIPKSVQEIHALVKDGLRFGELSEQNATLQDMLRQIQQQIKGGKEKPSESDAFKQMMHRMNEARDVARLHDDPVFVLAASPVDVVEIQDIFMGDSEIVRLINNPPELRFSGFDLNTGASSEIVRGQLQTS